MASVAEPEPPLFTWGRALDPHLFFPDPAIFPNANPDPAAFLMRIRIQLKNTRYCVVYTVGTLPYEEFSVVEKKKVAIRIHEEI